MQGLIGKRERRSHLGRAMLGASSGRHLLFGLLLLKSA